MSQEELLDELMKLHEEAHPGDRLSLHHAINEHRRKRTREKIKQSQPQIDLRAKLGMAGHEEVCKAITDFIKKELTDDDKDAGAGAIEDLLDITYKAMEQGDLEDIIMGLVMVYRKVWGWNPHLGPIQGLPK